MQDSFLQNDDNNQQDKNKKLQMPHSSRKMYKIQLTFLESFIKQISQVQAGIQQVLLELTKCQEGEKKRLPYSVLRSFEKQVKQVRSLKETTIEENGVYLEEVQNREKQKTYKNNLFKRYLKQLGQKREELKVYLNKLETRVRKLEDTGYAQFVQYDVVVPQVNTIRFSYSQRSFFIILTNRNAIIQKIDAEIQRRKQILTKITSQNKSDSNNLNVQNKQEHAKKSKNLINLPVILNEPLALTSVLSHYKTYKFYSNQCILANEILNIRNKKQQLQLETNRLKQALKMNEELLYKSKLKNGVLSGDPKFTKTDHFILLKQMQNQIKEKVEQRIFLRKENLKKYRSKSISGDRSKRFEQSGYNYQ